MSAAKVVILQLMLNKWRLIGKPYIRWQKTRNNMNENTPTSDSKLKAWLDNLQQESWQLELLVSGFVIFLLLGVYEPLRNFDEQMSHYASSSFELGLLGIPYAVLTAVWFFVLVNLLVHVLFRGLWISTVGLRYVSHDIDFDQLNFHPKFDRFLRKRAGSFDRYIEALEKICSIIFGFTFLLVFMMLSLGLYVAIIVGLMLGLQKSLGMSDNAFQPINNALNLFFTVSGLIYTIDFIGLGWLKRSKWTVHWYYPIYRMMGFMTAARLYRPLYYNLIDNKFGRRVGYLLVPYVILMMMLSSVVIIKDPYMPAEKDEQVRIRGSYYEDELNEQLFSRRPSIPDRYVENGFLEVFIPYLPVLDDTALQVMCSGLEPVEKAGLALRGSINLGASYSKVEPDSILFCMESLHRFYIDDSLYQTDGAYLYDHPLRKDQGLLTVLDVDSLSRGNHILRIESFRAPNSFSPRKGAPDWRENAIIPFWVVK